jgi:hypothetical protein
MLCVEGIRRNELNELRLTLDAKGDRRGGDQIGGNERPWRKRDLEGRRGKRVRRELSWHRD